MIMRTILTPKIRQRLTQIDTAVHQAERRLERSKDLLPMSVEKERSYYTIAPRIGMYHPTPTTMLLSNIERLELSPNMNAAVLGSALGSSSFALALHFAKVTGIEYARKLVKVAREIGQELDIDNVEFEHGDFLDADLSGFDFIYTYQPFLLDYERIMPHIFAELKPGTVIMANILPEFLPAVFPKENFTRLYNNVRLSGPRLNTVHYPTYVKT